MNFCKDCIHHAANPTVPDAAESAVCSRIVREPHMVTGETKPAYCEIERRFGECGLDAKFFEPITVTRAAAE